MAWQGGAEEGSSTVCPYWAASRGRRAGRYSTVQYSSVRYSTAQYGTVQYSHDPHPTAITAQHDAYISQSPCMCGGHICICACCMRCRAHVYSLPSCGLCPTQSHCLGALVSVRCMVFVCAAGSACRTGGALRSHGGRSGNESVMERNGTGWDGVGGSLELSVQRSAARRSSPGAIVSRVPKCSHGLVCITPSPWWVLPTTGSDPERPEVVSLQFR